MISNHQKYIDELLALLFCINSMNQQQLYFGEEYEQVTPISIKTTFGDIFAKSVGTHGQPLIIVVHGSGPKNSADQYDYLLHEYLVRASYLEKFFIIAIDCPGYGRSKGSKEAIKTFPLQMFRQILKFVNYRSYFAMFGHSQGGAAIFNAVHEDPSLTEYLLMDRPVCGNIKRFEKFALPTLLIYDIEDDGHPIWQGKLLYQYLLTSQFHTYRDSRDPYYVPDNIWNLILSFLQRYSQKRNIFTSNRNRGQMNRTTRNQIQSHSPRKKNQSVEEDKQKREEFIPRSNKKFKKQKPVSMDKYNEIKKEREEEQKVIITAIPEIDQSELHSHIDDLEELEDLPVTMNQPKIQQSPQEAKKYEQRKEKLEDKMIPQHKEEQKPKVLSSNQEKKQKKQTQGAEDKCSICYEIYFEPVETNCKHNFCKMCIGQSYLVDNRCPLCRTKITSRKLNEKLRDQSLSKLSEEEQKERKKKLDSFEKMLQSIVFIEIGNNSRELATKPSAFSKTKKKYMWELYAKQPRNFKFEEVLFNINMGERDSKPIRVSNAPFCFESRGTFSFSCEITIKPRNKEYGTITSVYRIDVAPGNHHKMIAVKKKKN